MRKVTYGAACSLDGFITGPGGSLDWLHWSQRRAVHHGVVLEDVDTILMGRKDVGGRGGGSPERPDEPEDAVLCLLENADGDRCPGVTLVKSDPGKFVGELKTRSGGDICVLGGSDFARSLRAAGVVEVGCNVHSVLLGSRVPLSVDGESVSPSRNAARFTEDASLSRTQSRLTASPR